MDAPAETAKNASPVQPTGYLMGWFGTLVLAGFLVVAAWNGQSSIAILLGVSLAAAGLARLWSRVSLAGVSCRRSLSEHRLFPGDYLELKLGVVNRKILPVPWIQVDTGIPVGLSDGSLPIPGDKPGLSVLSRSTALLWYTEASWRCRLYGRKRGYYPLGDTRVSSGDIFGFYPRSITIPSSDHVIVYPKLYTVTGLDIPSLYPLGETVSRRRMFEDPTRAIGVRDYTPRDSLRHIHWKASARHQKLQVKVFEASTTVKAALFLAVDTFRREGAPGEEELELGISTAASVARYGIEHGNSVGLFVNSRQADSAQAVRILPGGDASHLISMLEALARVTGSATSPTVEFFQNERLALPLGTTLIFVLRYVPATLNDLLISLKNSGYRVEVLQIGNEGDGCAEAGIPWRHVHLDSNLERITFGEGK